MRRIMISIGLVIGVGLGFSMSVQAASVDRVKGDRVLLLLEEGDEFYAGDTLDLYDSSGDSKGQVEIQQLKKTKAYATLIEGKARPGYSTHAGGRQRKKAGGSKKPFGGSGGSKHSSRWMLTMHSGALFADKKVLEKTPLALGLSLFWEPKRWPFGIEGGLLIWDLTTVNSKVEHSTIDAGIGYKLYNGPRLKWRVAARVGLSSYGITVRPIESKENFSGLSVHLKTSFNYAITKKVAVGVEYRHPKFLNDDVKIEGYYLLASLSYMF